MLKASAVFVHKAGYTVNLKMKIIKIILLTLITQNAMAEEKKTTEEEIQVMAIKRGDPKFAEGRKNAQRTIKTFLEIHSEHKENIAVYFAIKVGVLNDDGSTDYLWYNFEREEKGKLYAYHYNIPEDLKEFEKVKVEVNEISDWVINDHGYLIGGWSVRLQRERIPETERAKFDESTGIKHYRENDF